VLDVEERLKPLMSALLYLVDLGIDLYSQCEATPASAMRFIAWVRSCTSTGMP